MLRNLVLALKRSSVHRLFLERRVNHPEIDDAPRLVHSLYRAAFGRVAEPGGLAVRVRQLQSGMSVEVLAEEFVGSPEFQARHGTSPAVDVKFVTALYRDALGREPDQEGLAAWLAAGATRAKVLSALAASHEALENVPLSAEGMFETWHWNWWPGSERSRRQIAAFQRLTEEVEKATSIQNEALQRLTEEVEKATSIQNQALQRLSNQVGEIPPHLQALQRELPHAFSLEIDRLDSYLVYHTHALEQQINQTTSKLQALVSDLRLEIGRRAPVYVQTNLDALLIAGEFDLLVPTSEEGLFSYVARHGIEIEPGVRAILRDRLVPGATAVDIGANIGLHALGMAQIVGPGGRLVCLEPLPDIASTLNRTLRLNGFADRSQVICAAASDIHGEASLHRASHSPMSSLFPISGEGTLITVKTMPLDDCFAPGQQIDLVKMDVEGAEPLVYRGMRRILSENPGIELILEWSPSHFVRSKEPPESFWDLIRSDGFKALLIDNERPGRLAILEKTAAIPEAATILLTRKS